MQLSTRNYRYHNRVPATRPKFEYLTEIRGTKIILTDHAKQRALSRHGMPLEQMKSWFIEMSDVWASIPVEYYNQEVFVYSRKYQRGMILAYRRDCKNTSRNDLALVVVTVYPYGKDIPAKADTKIYRG